MLKFDTLMTIAKSKWLTPDEVLDLTEGTAVTLIYRCPVKGTGKVVTATVIHRLPKTTEYYYTHNNFPKFTTSPSDGRYYLEGVDYSYFFRHREFNEVFAVIPCIK